MKSFWLILVALTLSACGKFSRLEDGGFTRVTFQSQGADATTLTGGIFIYAYSQSYAANLKIANESGAASIDLPNGAYSFYAFGYDTSINNNSAMRCGLVGESTPVPLTGTAVNVPLVLTATNCTLGHFTDNSGYLAGTQPGQLQHLYCNSSAATYITTAGNNVDCNTMSYQPSNLQAFRYVLPLFKSAGGSYLKISEGYRSDCNLASSQGTPSSQRSRFPIGNSARPGLFPLEIESFSETACTSSPVSTHRFNNGLIFGPTTGVGRIQAGSSGSVRLFLIVP